MPTQIIESIEAVADRPPIQHIATRAASNFGQNVRDDLNKLADVVSTALRHCEELSRSAPAQSSPDMQRDVLHLQARISGVTRLIGDASDTLERIQKRTASEFVSRN